MSSSPTKKTFEPESSIKLENSVVNRQTQHLRELDCLWEKIGDKLGSVQDSLPSPVRRQLSNFSRCGQEHLYRVCRDCGKWESLDYQCCIKWCPRCVWKLTRQRQEALLHWTSQIRQPKHLVTTQLNSAILTHQDFLNNARNIRALQRQVVFRSVNGGCASTELTYKSQGWHLHTHWLIDADWVDAKELAVSWGKLVGQNFAIVKVKDARAQDYRREVAKYVVKSTELASWRPQKIAEFVSAIYKTRLFVKFGTLRTAPAPEKKPLSRVCACGCGEFIHESEQTSVLRQLRRERV